MPSWDPQKIAADLKWLQEHPWFHEKPASIVEFLGPDYLNIAKGIRPGVLQELVELFGDEVNGFRVAKYRWGMFTGAIGIGKQLRPEELILTPSGWVRNDSLVPGSKVIGSKGTPITVTHVFDHEDVQMYRMTFKDGTWIDCGGEHLWEVSYKSSYGKFKTEVVDTEFLSKQKLLVGGSYKYRIPIVLPVEFAEVGTLPIDPWALGALIANGGMTQRSISYSTGDEWCADRLEKALAPLGVHLSDGGHCKYTISDDGALRRKNSNPLMQVLVDLNMAGIGSRDKFIPEIYLRASVSDRWSLLRGLMDNDGSAFGKNTQVYSTSSCQLSRDVAELVRSLGGYCTVTEFERNGATEYQVHVNMDQECPFSLPRKVANWSPRTNQRPVKSIVSVEKIDRGPGRCIKVDAPDSLYVTKDYIVTHNTTMASVILPYMVHWVLCLKDPQDFFNLLPGSRIAFMMMSTSEDQAKETVFGDVKARIKYSPWFRDNFPYDPDFKNQIRFDKDIWILPGSSQETSFEGYNILGGILDEADSHKVTQNKDYGEDGWNTINGRIDSRFQDRGFLLTVGQMKKANGFAARKYKELNEDPQNAHTVRMTIWESLGWDFPKYLNPDGTRNSFWYDSKRKEIVTKEAAALLGFPEHIMEIPRVYEKNFRNKPEQALRDLAGIPPQAGAAFISLVHRVEECFERWTERYGPEQPVGPDARHPALAEWFRSPTPLRRAVHLDIGYSGNGDAAGIVMGHVSHLVKTEEDDEDKPYIVIDCIVRVKAAPGQEVLISDLRNYIYEFKRRGFRIQAVTMDGFQSTDTRQQLRKKKLNPSYLSVDKSKLPYEDLRDAIYEQRLEIPPYLTYLNPGEGDPVNIALKEIIELEDTGRKIDHPVNGSKDVADGLAGVVKTLMGDRVYRKRTTLKTDDEPKQLDPNDPFGYGAVEPSSVGSFGGNLHAPLPPVGGMPSFPMPFGNRRF